MTDQELRRANSLRKEIMELEDFIRTASNVWQGKIVKSRYVFKTVPYGIFGEKEFLMKTQIKDKVLDILEEYLSDLKEELENI